MVVFIFLEVLEMTSALDLVALVERYGAVTSSMDVDAYVALFSEDCVREDPIGQPPCHGRAEVHASWAGVVATSKTVTFTPSGIHGVENQVAYNFTVRVEMEAMTVTISGIETFVFNDAGEITEMRAYWNNDDVMVG
jgi:steroid delta-isomerase